MTQEREIKLPPLPAGYGSSIAAAMREYARAAVALNAPGWIRTASQLPPNTDADILAMYKSGHSAVTCGADVRELWTEEAECPFWMPIPPLPAGPEAT